MAESTVTLADVEAFIKKNPDEPAGDVFPDDSFAKSAYLNANQAELAHSEPSDAKAEHLEKWGLTAEEWSQQMKAVARARGHDARLDMLKEGVGRV